MLKKIIKLIDPSLLDWYEISKNPDITMDIIQNNPNKPWNWVGLSLNPNITLDFIQSNQDKPWDWYSIISQKPTITFDFIKKNLNKDWDWYFISQNPGIGDVYLKINLTIINISVLNCIRK